MKRHFISILTILILACAALPLSCSQAETSSLKVVTSTSLIAQIVERVGGGKVDVTNIIPPAQCPGHFDVKPSDIQKLADADLFLLHGWQGEKFSQELIASANNPDLKVTTINVKIGDNVNWMTPPVQLAATEKVAAALLEVDAQNSAYYQARAGEYKDRIKAKETELRARLAEANLKEVNVLCAEQQAGFVNWAGFNIIATYGRPDSLTPQAVKDLVDQGRAQNVTLILDNLQSGADAGKAVAEELGSKRIILSNFPGGFDDTGTWEKAIDRNIELILNALGG